MPKLKIGLIVLAASVAYYGSYALNCRAYSSIHIVLQSLQKSLYSRFYSFQGRDDLSVTKRITPSYSYYVNIIDGLLDRISTFILADEYCFNSS